MVDLPLDRELRTGGSIYTCQAHHFESRPSAPRPALFGPGRAGVERAPIFPLLQMVDRACVQGDEAGTARAIRRIERARHVSERRVWASRSFAQAVKCLAGVAGRKRAARDPERVRARAGLTCYMTVHFEPL